MSPRELVLSEIEAGSNVRIIEDFFGQEKVEIRRGWFPIGSRYQLPRHDMVTVRVALSVRGRTNARFRVPVHG